jgi:hypothetical protein
MTTSSSKQSNGQALRVIIYDGTLDLAECEELAKEYRYKPPFALTIEARWGGPAAGGIGWGGPEIAVYLVVAVGAAEVLRRLAGDVYDVAKTFVLNAYRKVRRETAGRIYEPIAVVIEDDQSPLALAFVLTHGLSEHQVRERLAYIADHWQSELEKWRGRYGHWAKESDRMGIPIKQINLCWDEEGAEWVECEPAPPQFGWYMEDRPEQPAP